jgi:hypothetical protein
VPELSGAPASPWKPLKRNRIVSGLFDSIAIPAARRARQPDAVRRLQWGATSRCCSILAQSVVDSPLLIFAISRLGGDGVIRCSASRSVRSPRSRFLRLNCADDARSVCVWWVSRPMAHGLRTRQGAISRPSNPLLRVGGRAAADRGITSNRALSPVGPGASGRDPHPGVPGHLQTITIFPHSATPLEPQPWWAGIRPGRARASMGWMKTSCGQPRGNAGLGRDRRRPLIPDVIDSITADQGDGTRISRSSGAVLRARRGHLERLRGNVPSLRGATRLFANARNGRAGRRRWSIASVADGALLAYEEAVAFYQRRWIQARGPAGRSAKSGSCWRLRAPW